MEAAPEFDPDWVADADAGASPVAEAESVAEAALDPDSAWAADVDAVAQQMVAAGLLQDAVGTAETTEPVGEVAFAEAAVDEVLFVGFEEAAAEPVAEVVVIAAADGPVTDTERVLDVWVTPEVLGEWLEAPADTLAEVIAADPALEPAPEVADAEPFAGDTWFATDLLRAAAPEPEAVTPVAVPVVAVAQLQDRDAWERAFEEAAARIGWEEQFEAAINERISIERMDRSEAIADLASDLQEAAEEREEVASVAAWPPQERELTSRERIEAEGFSFVAPEASSSLDEFGEVWSRNGNGADHASEDARLR